MYHSLNRDYLTRQMNCTKPVNIYQELQTDWAIHYQEEKPSKAHNHCVYTLVGFLMVIYLGYIGRQCFPPELT